MSQSFYEIPYDDKYMNRNKSMNVSSYSNIAVMRNPIPHANNQQSTRSFYSGKRFEKTPRYAQTHGIYKMNPHYYQLRYGHSKNPQQQRCNVAYDAGKLIVNNNNHTLKTTKYNGCHNYRSESTSKATSNYENKLNCNNYKSCGNNIIVKVAEHMYSTSMSVQSDKQTDTSALGQSFSKETVTHLETSLPNDVADNECQNNMPTNNTEERHVDTNPKKLESVSATSSRDKTPMCLINDLTRYNKISCKYYLTDETGPPHCKHFVVTLKLGDEEYTAEGNKIKKTQHLVAKTALENTKYIHPIPKRLRRNVAHDKARYIMPTVELNALCMKLGLQPCYTFFNKSHDVQYFEIGHSICNDSAYNNQLQPFSSSNVEEGGDNYLSTLGLINSYQHHKLGLYKVTLFLGNQKFDGYGRTPQQAKHDAAARALPSIKIQVNDSLTQEKNENQSIGWIKSPISLVFEIGIKRNLPVNFKVVGEDGFPHMKIFTTACTVGSIVVHGKGACKRISKKRAAEKMLEELQKLPPIVTENVPLIKSKKRKARKIHHKSSTENTESANIHGKLSDTNIKTINIAEVVDEPTKNLLMKINEWCKKHNEIEPTFKIVAETVKNIRQMKFIVEGNCNGLVSVGIGKNRTIAHYKAAKNLVAALGIDTIEIDETKVQNEGPSEDENIVSSNSTESTNNVHDETTPETIINGPVKSVNLEDVSGRETSKAVKFNIEVEPNDKEPRKQRSTFYMKDQLMYLANLLGFEVNFSDYPQGNHSESLTIVMLSTSPPQICHGIGITPEESQENASKNALKILSEMGLNNVKEN